MALITAIGHVSLYATADSPGGGANTSEVTATASLGEALSLKRTTYKVTDVRTAHSTSGDPLHDHFLRGQIQPGASTRGSLVYDVSPSSVKGAELRVEDLSSDDKGRIELGL